MKHAFLDHHSGIHSPIHHLDARAKIVVFFTFILVGVSCPPASFSLFAVSAIALVAIALLARLPLVHLAGKLVKVLPFLLVVSISIPFMKRDGPGGEYRLGLGGLSASKSGLWILWNVMIKSSLGIFSVILLYSTTSFPRLIKGMERLGCPRIFTILISFMYRYSFVLVDEMQRMKRARDSRSFGVRRIRQLQTVGHMIATLFLRSFHRGERVYLAMLSRGYQGTMPATTSEKFGAGEWLFLILSPILILLRILLG